MALAVFCEPAFRSCSLVKRKLHFLPVADNSNVADISLDNTQPRGEQKGDGQHLKMIIIIWSDEQDLNNITVMSRSFRQTFFAFFAVSLFSVNSTLLLAPCCTVISRVYHLWIHLFEKQCLKICPDDAPSWHFWIYRLTWNEFSRAQVRRDYREGRAAWRAEETKQKLHILTNWEQALVAFFGKPRHICFCFFC